MAGYRFVSLADLAGRRQRLRDLTRRLRLKGTILLSPEGINLFVAGKRQSIDRFLDELRSHECFCDLRVKESRSERQPFNRMLVRIKKEIIAFRVDSVAPETYTSKRIDAFGLKQWMDQGRKLTLLDVRNDYEIELGTFAGAIPIGISSFRDFPTAVDRLPAAMKQQPIVTFCTGGIRCEKAAPFLEQKGFDEVYQLDGGILKYFEACGGQYYHGECFVFDQRVALDCQLNETNTAQCFVCQKPLSEEDQQSLKYVVGVSCPYCHESLIAQSSRRLEERHSAIRRMTRPLPAW